MLFRVLLVSTAVAEASPRDYSAYSFQDYVVEFGKRYSLGAGAESASREDIFNTNLQRIREHNAAYARGEHTWWMAVNHFADLTQKEFHGTFGRSAVGRLQGAPSPVRSLGAQELPSVVDWRNKSVLTAVKDQGHCGSCWAFASAEAVESAYAIATGEAPPVLAPQAYVSCSRNDDACGGTGGCHGSIAELAFNHTVTAGLPLERDYPYTATDTEDCQAYEAAVRVRGYEQLAANDAGGLATALATVGPVAVNVAATPMHLYGGGVFDGCSSDSTGANINHVVQAVGYSADYWIVRNSWGSAWGEDGFIRLSRSKDGTTATDETPGAGFACKPYPASIEVGGECGILSDAVYPVGAMAASFVV